LDAGIETHPIPVEPFAQALEWAASRKGRKGAWRKISLLRPGLADMCGHRIIFDIDVVITGPLGPIIDYAPEKVAFRREWRYARFGLHGGHGSVYTFDPERHHYLYDEFAADPIGSIIRHKGSEQYYSSITALRHGQLAYLPKELVCSYKRDLLPIFPLNLLLQPKLTKECSVLCFHGRPRIEDVIDGVSYPLRYRTSPCDWLRKYWAA
jgi:hypothetical protein